MRDLTVEERACLSLLGAAIGTHMAMEHYTSTEHREFVSLVNLCRHAIMSRPALEIDRDERVAEMTAEVDLMQFNDPGAKL